MSCIEYPSVLKDDSVTENHFGYQVADPYRWLEDPDSEQTLEFVKCQNAITEKFINSSNCLSQVKEELTSIWNYERFGCPVKYGKYYYYMHNTGLQNQSVLYQLEDLKSKPKVFLDPNTLDKDGLISLRGYEFSENNYLCYGTSYGGSDWFELKFKRTDTGEDLPDVLGHVKFSGIAWTKDESGVFYCKYLKPEGKADGTETTVNTNQKLMFHRLGTSQCEDILCLERPDQPTWTMFAEVSDCGRYVFTSLHDGCEPKNQLFFADLANIEYKITDKLKLVPIVDTFDAKFDYITNDDTLTVLLSNLNAPMHKLIVVDLTNSDRSAWKDLVPHNPNELLDSARCVNQDKLILCYLKDVKSCLYIHSLKTGERLTNIDLPLGSVTSISGNKIDTEAFIQFSSFLTPGQIFSYDFEQYEPKLQLFRESKPGNVNLDRFEVKQVFYKSFDDTPIPMFIVLPKDFNYDGSTPCELYGYGGFDISLTPSYSITRALFLLHFSGMFAVANIRGGGEYGKSWHDAGRLLNKQNTFNDFQAAAEYLIKNKYTNNKKMYINGGSNGGLLVSACCNQRPDLFGAAIAKVPVCDMLRFHKFTIGHCWISDYGNPECETDFKYIIRYSPLHNVELPRESTIQYPAMLIVTADHDDRVVPLHSFKFIATLQDKLCHSGDGRQTNALLARIDTKAGHGQGKPTAKLIEEAVSVFGFLQLTLSMTWKK